MKKQLYLDFIQTLLPSEEFEAFRASYQQRIAKSIKIIRQNIKKSDAISFLTEAGRELSVPKFSNHWKSYNDVLYVQKDSKASLGNHFLHQGGFFYVQEVAAGLSAQILNPQKWDKVLDLCAAPWGKTVQLADQLLQAGGGFVLANEPVNPRRKALIFNLNRCGLYNTAITAYRGEQLGGLATEMFDKVLVDAPCSGEGMNYKHDKNTLYRDAKLAQQFASMQQELLISGLQALKVGGELVYSTCTLNPLENEQVIARVLEQFAGAVELLPVEIDEKSPWLLSYQGKNILMQEQAQQVARFWPHLQHTGGFFIAKFRKLSSLALPVLQDKRTLAKKEKSWLESSVVLQEQVWRVLEEERGIPRQSQISFFSTPDAVYVTSAEFKELPSQLFIEKIGVPLFKIGFKGEWIPQQGLATMLGWYAQKQCFEVDNTQAQLLSDGRDLQGERGDEGKFLLLKWQGNGFALVKQVWGTLKNKM